MAAHDPGGDTVIAIGSMSKAFWAGLRIGWIRASPTLVQRLALARATVDLSSPVVEQLVATELLADPDAVLVPQRAALRARRDALAAALRLAAARLALRAPAGGLSLWIELDAPRSSALAAVAGQHGVRLAAGPRFGVDGAFERFPGSPTRSRSRSSPTRSSGSRSPGAPSRPTRARPAAEPPALVA